MRPRSTLALALAASLTLTLAAGAAEAAPDLAVSVSQPSNVYVYQPVRYTVRVSNLGNQRSQACTLTIELPRTATSPGVHLFGTLGATSPGCTLSGTTLTCPVGRIGNGSSAALYFDMEMPGRSTPLSFTARVNPVGTDVLSSNNSRTHVVQLRNFSDALALSAPVTVPNRHCTGRGLTSFYECDITPGSIATHDAVFEPGGTLTIPDEGGSYGGTWSQPTPDSLVFQYTYLGTPVANFVGYGVGGRCFEGLTTFPNNATYVAPYEVCIP